MSAILKFHFQKQKQKTKKKTNKQTNKQKKNNYIFRRKSSKLHKKTQFCMWRLHFPLNKGKPKEQAVDPLVCSGPISLPLFCP